MILISLVMMNRNPNIRIFLHSNCRQSRIKHDAWVNDTYSDGDETEQGEDGDCSITLPQKTNEKEERSANASKSRNGQNQKQRKR